MTQAQERPQEWLFGLAEQCHVRAVLAAAQYGAQRDQQNPMQVVAGFVLSRIGDVRKTGDELFHRPTSG